MKYENYTIIDRQDDILDKISKQGINSLTEIEKEFLDSFKSGDEDTIHKKMILSDIGRLTDDWNFFEFEISDVKNWGDKKVISGTLLTPDLDWDDFDDDNYIEGELKGEIVVYTDGQISLNFSKKAPDPKTGKIVEWDVFDFCNGLEHELESFIDYVISEVEKIDI